MRRNIYIFNIKISQFIFSPYFSFLLHVLLQSHLSITALGILTVCARGVECTDRSLKLGNWTFSRNCASSAHFRSPAVLVWDVPLSLHAFRVYPLRKHTSVFILRGSQRHDYLCMKRSAAHTELQVLPAQRHTCKNKSMFGIKALGSPRRTNI